MEGIFLAVNREKGAYGNLKNDLYQIHEILKCGTK